MGVIYSDSSVLCLYAIETLYKIDVVSYKFFPGTNATLYIRKNVNIEHGIKPPRPAPPMDSIRIICTSTITKTSLALACHYENAIVFLISAIALPGLNPLGHVREQLRMVWQR